MKKNLFAILLVAWFVILSSVAQDKSDKIQPRWCKDIPSSLNSTYSFKKTNAFGSSLKSAREDCLSTLTSNLGLQGGVVVISNNKSTESVSQTYRNGRLTETVNFDSKTTTDSKSNAISLQIVIIDEFWKYSNNAYELSVLYAVSDINKTATFDDISTTTAYGAEGLWRSAIVPGWGQMYKGSKLKGGLILGGVAAFAAGIVLTESLRAENINKASQTYDVDLIKDYSAKADNMATARNVCIGGAAALYIYNLIDAIVAPGARRVVVKKNGVTNFAVSPAVTQDFSGMAMSFNF